jgi:hypothetical protein
MTAIDTWSRWRIFSSSYKSYKWQRLTLDQGEGYSHPLISLTNDSDYENILHHDQVSIAVTCKIYKRMRIPFTMIKCQSLLFVLTLDHGEGYSHPLISLTNDSDWHLIMVKDILPSPWSSVNRKTYKRMTIPFTMIKCQSLLLVRLIRGWECPSPWSSINRCYF